MVRKSPLVKSPPLKSTYLTKPSSPLRIQSMKLKACWPERSSTWQPSLSILRVRCSGEHEFSLFWHHVLCKPARIIILEDPIVILFLISTYYTPKLGTLRCQPNQILSRFSSWTHVTLSSVKSVFGVPLTSQIVSKNAPFVFIQILKEYRWHLRGNRFLASSKRGITLSFS